MHTPAQIVTRIQIALVKSRSTGAENGTLELDELLWPRLYGTEDPLSLMNVCSRLQSKAEITEHDVFNLLGIASRLPTFGVLYYLRWEEDMPTPIDYLRESQSV